MSKRFQSKPSFQPDQNDYEGEAEPEIDLAELMRGKRDAELREIIHKALNATPKRLTPEAIAAYAALHLVRDDGEHAGEPIEPAAHHQLWLRLLCDQRIRKLLIIAPPESAKTTWVLSAYMGCRLGFYPQQNVIIASATAEVAESRSLSLRGSVDSEAWRQTFPGVLPVRAAQGHLRWGASKWSLAPGGIPFSGRLHPSIAAYGTGGTIEGGRADELLGDDLLNFESARSPTQRVTTKNWAHASFLSRRKAVVGRAVIIGTSWHPEDYLSEIRKAGDWVVCHVSLLGDGPEVYATMTYPDDWGYEMLGARVGQAELAAA